MGSGATSRLCPLRSEYRTAADEAWRLQFRDVTIVYDEDLKKTIMEIEVRESVGWILHRVMPGAVLPFSDFEAGSPGAHLRRERAHWNVETSAVPSGQGRTPEPTDLIFLSGSESFSKLSSTRKAPHRHEGSAARRTAYGIHTYACD